MSEKNVATAVAYYQAMGSQDLTTMEKCLHPEVQFIGPMAEMKGKEAVLEAAKRFCSMITKVTIRAQFGSNDQAMLAYDMDCPAPIGIFRAATLMTFKDSLIVRLELFYDARPFEKKKEEIFSTS
ncbi:MAG: hypothetical protein JWO53_334 [Chlamydiia bacterium]|nr:hypothetical protein [Chlamydiia bacterium]